MRQMLLVIALFFSTSLAQAGLILEGTFNATFDSSLPEYQGIPTLSGSFLALFDSSQLTGAANENFNNLSFESFILDQGTVGGLAVNETNARYQVNFQNGLLNGICFGAPSACDLSPDMDAFYFLNTSHVMFAAVSTAAMNGNQSTRDSAFINISVNQVPTPATLALLGLGLAGLGFSRRKKA